MTTLGKTTQAKLLEMVKSIKPASGWKVMIVDAVSVRVLSSACRMYDIMDSGVTLVEPIALARQPLPDMEALYFIQPSEQSIKKLIEDFKRERPLYACAHLFFTTPVPKFLWEKLKAEKQVTARIRTCKELNLEFLTKESHVFSFDMKDSFYNLYSPDSNKTEADIDLMATRLMTVCSVLGEFPVIRHSGKPIVQRLAQSVLQRLEALQADSRGAFPPQSDRERATLLVLDRSHDPIAPLLHEFTYQAMIYDLLPVVDDQCEYKYTDNANREQVKKVMLDEARDHLFSDLRHSHIAETIQTVLAKFNEFAATNKTAQFRKGENVKDLKSMSEAIKNLPQFQELLSGYSLHMNLAGACMAKFNALKLLQVATVEQDMVMGEDANGQAVKNHVAAMTPVLRDPQVLPADKLRLLLLYVVSQGGIIPSDRDALLTAAGLSISSASAMVNLPYLGVELKKGRETRKASRPKRENKYEISRFQPHLYDILEDLCEATPEKDSRDRDYKEGLSAQAYPILNPPSASAASAAKTTGAKAGGFLKKTPAQTTEVRGGRIIIFIAGGMTFSEIRTCYELGKHFKREIIIGSTNHTTPSEFVAGVEGLSKLKTVE